jgi:hypothetical protein
MSDAPALNRRIRPSADFPRVDSERVRVQGCLDPGGACRTRDMPPREETGSSPCHAELLTYPGEQQ